MSFNDISAFLVTTLTPLLTAKRIKKIYPYEPDEIKGMPCISIVPTTTNENFYSTQNNEVVYTFLILIFDDLASKTKNKSFTETQILALADDALDLLRKADPQDAGGFLGVPKVGGAKYLQRTTGNCRAFEIQYSIVKKLSRY